MLLRFGARAVFELTTLAIGVYPVQFGFGRLRVWDGGNGADEAERGRVGYGFVREVLGGKGQVEACEGMGRVAIVFRIGRGEFRFGVFGP